MKKFKPLLAVDATDHLDKISYPKYASVKLDGIRCIFHPELGMVSRSLKQIPNKQLQEKFKDLIDMSKDMDMIFDGELYSHKITFQGITRAVMTKDFDDEKTKKKLIKEMGVEHNPDIYTQALVNNIEFHIFEYMDRVIDNNTTFECRTLLADNIADCDNVEYLNQSIVNSSEEVKELFSKKLDEGYEGLILRDPKAPYKFGRSTLKEENCLKVKPFETFDAKIIDVIQATVVDPSAEKKTNELGRSVTSRKKDDRIAIEKAACFSVAYEKSIVRVSIAMTDEEKEEIWKNKDSYIGRMIEYKGMLIGAKDVPRHPVFVRFREDKD